MDQDAAEVEIAGPADVQVDEEHLSVPDPVTDEDAFCALFNETLRVALETRSGVPHMAGVAPGHQTYGIDAHSFVLGSSAAPSRIMLHVLVPQYDAQPIVQAHDERRLTGESMGWGDARLAPAIRAQWRVGVDFNRTHLAFAMIETPTDSERIEEAIEVAEYNGEDAEAAAQEAERTHERTVRTLPFPIDRVFAEPLEKDVDKAHRLLVAEDGLLAVPVVTSVAAMLLGNGHLPVVQNSAKLAMLYMRIYDRICLYMQGDDGTTDVQRERLHAARVYLQAKTKEAKDTLEQIACETAKILYDLYVAQGGQLEYVQAASQLTAFAISWLRCYEILLLDLLDPMRIASNEGDAYEVLLTPHQPGSTSPAYFDYDVLYPQIAIDNATLMHGRREHIPKGAVLPDIQPPVECQVPLAAPTESLAVAVWTLWRTRIDT